MQHVPEQPHVTESTIMKRYKRWGGVARIVFGDEDKLRAMENELQDALKEPSVLKGIIDRTSSKVSLLDDSFTKRCQFSSPLIVDSSYTMCTYDWQSCTRHCKQLEGPHYTALFEVQASCMGGLCKEKAY